MFYRQLSTLISLLVICEFANASAALIGNGVDAETGAPVYQEQHSNLIDEQGRRVMVTRYVAPDDSEIANRRVVFEKGRVLHYELNQPTVERFDRVSRLEDGILFNRVVAGEVVPS